MSLQHSTEAGYAAMDPHCLTVGTSEVAFPAPNPHNVRTPERIFVQALLSNTDNITISLTGVAADGSQGGFVIPPAADVVLLCNREDLLRAISGTPNQKLSVVYLAKPI